MGRAKQSWKLELTDAEGSALPDLEYDIIHEPNFSVALESIRVKERREFSIPGLMTRDVALTQKYLDLINVFSVKVEFQSIAALPETWFVIKGSTSVQELTALVHGQYDLNAGVELQLWVGDKVLPYDSLMATVYKESSSPDSCLYIVCRLENGAAN